MKKEKLKKSEKKGRYCFTLKPTTMDKVEQETGRHAGRSVSLMVELILSERYANGKPEAL